MASSNVGSSQIYEDGDQKNISRAEVDQMKKDNRFHEGKENSHLPNDSKDERSIANKLEREEKRRGEPDPISEEAKLSQKDATAPARMHGNEPSRGAKIDQELREEEEAQLKKKGAA